MNTINLDRYMPELTAMYAFYRYSEAVFKNQGPCEEIADQEFRTLLVTALPYLKVDPENPKEVEGLFKEKIHEQVVEDIEGGLAVLRRQILGDVAAVLVRSVDLGRKGANNRVEATRKTACLTGHVGSRE